MDPMTARPPVKRAVDPLDPAVVLTFEDLQAIGTLLRRNIASREELFTAVQKAAALNVEGVKITLEPRLLERLKSRCLDKANWAQWLTKTVISQLHDFAGY